MQFSRRLATVVAFVIGGVALAMGANEDLRKAEQLFEARDYAAAQETLLTINRDELSDEDKAAYDRLAATLPEAIQGAEKAAQDLAAGEAAYEAGEWDAADQHFEAVSANPYASEEALGRARTMRQKIVEKKQLAEAAAPQGPVPAAEDSGQPAQQPQPERQEAESTLPTGPTRLTIVEQLRRQDELKWQRAVANMRETARQAREAVAENRYSEARMLAQQALTVIEAARIYADPPSKYETERAAAIALRDEVEQAAQRYTIERAAQEQREIQTQVEERREQQERQRQEKVQQLFATADQLRRERKYEEAAETIRQVLILDPANAQASLLIDTYDDLASLAAQADIFKTRDRQMRGALVDSAEALIPWYQEILYPKNWPEITVRRLGLDRQYGLGGDSELNRLLDKPGTLSEFNFDDEPLDRVINHLAEQAQVNMNVDWQDLALAGIERDAPVSIRLRDVSYRTALREVLTQVGGSVTLAYNADDGIVRVATKEKLDQQKFTQVYDIRDLLIDIPKFAGPRLDLGEPVGAPYTGPGSSLFEGANHPHPGDDEQLAVGNRAMADEIMDIIRQTVEPNSWRESGGGDGALRELNGQLIVYNTSDSHRQVTNLLDQLRETRALQIAVESRFLIVTSNFLEEIGVDLDFVFNSGTAGYDPALTSVGAPITNSFTGAPVLIPRPFSRAGTFASPPGFGTGLGQGQAPAQPFGNAAFVPPPGGIFPSFNDMTPIPVQTGSIGIVDPGGINTQVPGSFGGTSIGPALNIAGSYLDNLQVDFLIRATQANRRSSIVQAPRLMMFNGQRAYVAIQRTSSYVSTLTPSVAEGAVAVAPVIAQVNSGSVLDVEGTISHDRRYVTLTVRTTMQEDPTFERFETQRGSGNSPGLFVLLPEQQVRVINTTVSVPDGGTVLLGGLKQVGEVEIDAGVPILSKIPILKRAFTNTTTVKDTQTLLILLRAKILIQQEAEEDVFPGLGAG